MEEIMNRVDRYILMRMTLITLLVLVMLIFIFIVIDFSENSDDFTDRGATMNEIWNNYYMHYIPEIIRLVTPVAVFVACLLVVGKMTQNLEMVALKAAGVSLYRFLLPFVVFGLIVASGISYLDGYIVPKSNEARIIFERTYILTRSDRVERSTIYRQESPQTIYTINFYAPQDSTAYRVHAYRFDGERISETLEAQRMTFNGITQKWSLINAVKMQFDETGYNRRSIAMMDTALTIFPRDLARTTSDIFQLTYPEAREYIQSLQRIGASGIELPKVQFYGRLTYPLSIVVVCLIGVAIASIRRKGGTGFHLGLGLAVSFLYLAFMKLIEPFGYAGVIDPVTSAIFPHLFFLTIAVVSVVLVRK